MIIMHKCWLRQGVYGNGFDLRLAICYCVVIDAILIGIGGIRFKLGKVNDAKAGLDTLTIPGAITRACSEGQCSRAITKGSIGPNVEVVGRSLI